VSSAIFALYGFGDTESGLGHCGKMSRPYIFSIHQVSPHAVLEKPKYGHTVRPVPLWAMILLGCHSQQYYTVMVASIEVTDRFVTQWAQVRFPMVTLLLIKLLFFYFFT
jgi:hypothetical protein